MALRLPVYTTVTLALSVLVLCITLIAVSDLLGGLGDMLTPKERLEEVQAAKNAFHNLVFSLESCLVGEKCMCEIYEHKLPSGFRLSIAKSAKGSSIKLFSDTSLLLSEEIPGLRLGILEDAGKDYCTQSQSLDIVNNDGGWYASEDVERNYFLSGIPELYKWGKSSACLVTETMFLGSGLESVTGRFSSLPRCTFVQKKKEEAAISSFNELVVRLKSCGGSLVDKDLKDCTCDISGISFPEGYVAKFDVSGNLSSARLVRLKNLASNDSILVQASLPFSGLFVERGFGDVKRQNELCMALGSIVEGCSTSNGVIETQSPKVYMLESSMVFMQQDTGIMKFGKSLVDKGSVISCNAGPGYNLSWPLRVSSPYYFTGSCFGKVGDGCNPGLVIPAYSGSKVYSAEDGFVEYSNIDTKVVMVRHLNGLHTRYGSTVPSVKVGKRVIKGDKLGKVAGDALLFWVRDENVDTSSLGGFCPQAPVVRQGFDYVNPYCYMGERNRVVAPEGCVLDTGCDAYGNSASHDDDYSLRVLAIPVNWEKRLPYLMFANDALEKFTRASPLSTCPDKVKRLFADGKINYGGSWEKGSCRIANLRNCYNSSMEMLSKCAEEFRSSTGEDYDFVLGIDDSNIALAPDCDYNDRGWTFEGSNSIMVESQYTSDAIHELGHKFGLRDQYCDCSGTEAYGLCGPDAIPNPLREELGCAEDCCKEPIVNYPYLEGCKWCIGNHDLKSVDNDNDGTLDFGKRTAMSNLVDSSYYSMDEYFFLSTHPKLRCE
ncbi:MAG: peptidoglycan DD-metalloendopeptidase family protein [Candidatus Woesearchaeota archaeon]